MADIHIVRAHGMALKKARDAANDLAAKLQDKFDLTSEWEGDTLNFQRPGVTGSLAITKSEVVIDVRLGLLLSAFKGAMEEQIGEQLDKLFGGAAAAPAKKVAKKKA
jgi:putative polyhydroxyalkanoate system protein